MYSAITQPNTYSNGYSFVPIRLNDSDATTVESYKYLINIAYNGLTITTSEAYSYDGGIYTKLTFATAHEYAIGDILLLEDSSGLYSGYYIVLLAPSTTTLVVDLTLGAAMTGTVETQNVVKYKVNPDPDFEAKIDLSNTLKDFVTQNLTDTSEIYAGPNTRFEYDLKFGYEGNAVFSFDDNIFQSGNIGFVDASLTAVTQVQFNVGDIITIQQDLYSWDYTDNFFDSGYVGYTGVTGHNFASGDTITVTGQITNPSYNGPNTVNLSVDTYGVRTSSAFLSSSPVEPGTIYGVITPEYNTTATITNIVYSAGTGVIIITDIPFAQNTPAIGGTIKHADGRYITVLDSLAITGLSVYNSYVNQLNYSIDEFDKYVCQTRAASGNNISTILGNTDRHRIEASTKSWLLAHSDGSNYWEPRFTFYDSSSNFLSEVKIDFNFTYGSNVGINSYVNNGGNLQILLAGAHGMSVGDTLLVVGAIPAYNGVWEVIEVNSTTQLTVNNAYVANVLNGAEYVKEITGGAYDDYYFPVGLDQLLANTSTTLLSGSSLASVAANVDYYKVELESGNAANTNPIYFEINNDCSRYELYHLMWKDARGSWLSYPFKYLSRDKTDVDKKNYYQTNGTWSSNSFDFDSYGRGERTYFARSRDKVTLNSGWVEEFENALIKDLMQSASVYVQTPDNVLVACTIDNKKIEFGKNINEQVFQYKFDIVYSNDEIRL